MYRYYSKIGAALRQSKFKTTNYKRGLYYLGVYVIFSLCSTLHAQILNPQPLYSLAGSSSQGTEPQEIWRVPVNVNFEVIGQGRYLLPLPDGETLVADETRNTENTNSNYSARDSIGTLSNQQGEDLGTFVLSHVDLNGTDGIYLSIRPRDGLVISLRKTSQGVFSLSKYDLRFSNCAGANKPITAGFKALDSSGAAIPTSSASTSSPIIIDLMLAYTPNTVRDLGDLAGATALLQAGVIDTNQAFINSQINITLRLVSLYAITSTLLHETNPTDANWTTDLYSIWRTNDGILDQIHQVRNASGADIVSVISSPGPTQDPNQPVYAGRGFMLTTNPADSFSIVSQQAAVANHSLAHELAHNLGAQHDLEHSNNSPGYYPYSYGWRWIGSSQRAYRSIMAYYNQSGTWEERVPYFSNPNVLHENAATGTSTADNARTLNQTAALVAAFRGTIVPIVTATPTPISTIGGTPIPTPYPTPSPKPKGNGKGRNLANGRGRVMGLSRCKLATNKLKVIIRNSHGAIKARSAVMPKGYFEFQLKPGKYTASLSIPKRQRTRVQVAPSQIGIKLSLTNAANPKFRLNRR